MHGSSSVPEELINKINQFGGKLEDIWCAYRGNKRGYQKWKRKLMLIPTYA